MPTSFESPPPANDLPPGSPEYWQLAWEWQLWHHRCNPTRTLHSKEPQEPTEGFIRLAYPWHAPANAAGPNYFYLRPEWITMTTGVSNNPRGYYHVTWREPGRKEVSSAFVDKESYGVAAGYYLERQLSRPQQLKLF